MEIGRYARGRGHDLGNSPPGVPQTPIDTTYGRIGRGARDHHRLKAELPNILGTSVDRMEALVRELWRAGTGGCCAPTQAEKFLGTRLSTYPQGRGGEFGVRPRAQAFLADNGDAWTFWP